MRAIRSRNQAAQWPAKGGAQGRPLSAFGADPVVGLCLNKWLASERS